MRLGYTTGSCASAAAKAAVNYLLNNEEKNKIEIDLPNGGKLEIPVQSFKLENNWACAEVIKDAGDDPDVTNGISILADVLLLPHEEILVEGGEGIGVVTKPGLSVEVGQPAITPVPLKMIKDNVGELLPPGKGAKIIISAPIGEEIAKKTLNKRLGIMGGISILGRSGIVRPMSNEAYIESLLPQITQAKAMGYKTIILTPGGKGNNKAIEMGAPQEAIVQTGNYIGKMIDHCVDLEIEAVILMGHVGKLIKVAAGIFQTDSRLADGRRETLAAHLAMQGAPVSLIKEIMRLNTIEASLEILGKHGMLDVFRTIADTASERIRERTGDQLKVGTILYNINSDLIAFNEEALNIGSDLFE
ncbi:Cobalt-precorrin-5B (C1)-methyltransferase [Candidatus Syntrophocurvum alkaliphilum]|uniref:Cobalt-precorrin-5B C(1)-methyltransferase n=1 Tax=Candidatus Syntrophocurvum alkaliphilum TaxID=2293317 RepID=A0A6I6DJP2_9FIRM|nr:cobalt-precorrin-5B (C(1))-methyltransferase CbiD [Candidatus Syntrophocurvum alkaliphilum]QGU00254.1 Cobalt-precorrin-5B (C1)-methyltransferase [Candidatus Syntrophocurvum alkaliphilum]